MASCFKIRWVFRHSSSGQTFPKTSANGNVHGLWKVVMKHVQSVSSVSFVCSCELVEYCKGTVCLLFICFVVITSKLTTAKRNMLTYLTLLNLHFNTCKFTYYFGLTIILVCRLTQLYLKMTSTLLLCWFLCLCYFFIGGAFIYVL